MAVDDFVDVGGVDIAVPDAFGVDHCHRPLGTTIKATCPIGPNLPRPMSLGSLKPCLGMGLGIHRTKVCAAFGTTVALVDTKKDMTLKISHAVFYVAYGERLGERLRRRLGGDCWLAIMSIHMRKANGQTSKQK